MRLHKKIKSNIDNSVKYIFLSNDNLAVEATYIDKNDGKNIICVPSETSCGMRCKFCHITDIADRIVHRKLNYAEIADMIDYIYNDMQLGSDKMLLISFMGCGEPLMNIYELMSCMAVCVRLYKKVRFAISTSLPKNSDDAFDYLTEAVKAKRLNVKLHLSLHYTNDEDRYKWMPYASSIQKSLEQLKRYKCTTKNPVEIHYTLIDGVNDRDSDIEFLINHFANSDICIKFIRYNSKDTIQSNETPIARAKHIMKVLQEHNVQTEYYTPPGRDIGGSCGQILVEEYLEHNLGAINFKR